MYAALRSFTTTTQQLFYGPLSGTTLVSLYRKKHSPTHLSDHRPIFIGFFHLPRSIASSCLSDLHLQTYSWVGRDLKGEPYVPVQ